MKARVFTYLLFTSYLCFQLWAQVPDGYYQSAYGKQGAVLKTALYHIIKSHKSLDYYGLNITFKTTDWHPNEYYWDMYSEYKRTYWTGMNREHSLPKSWFGVSYGSENAQAIGCDVHNLFPSDENINAEKNNFPLGVAGTSPFLSNSFCKVGSNTYPGYQGAVFEPANEYKGDFARTYMYMVTCYEDYANKWQSTGTLSMLQRNTYPVFNTYAVKLLMEWHRSDSVSLKEKNRNNAVYGLQSNRNPFVDYPMLAEYIWGKFTNEQWDGTADEPETADALVVEYNNANQTIFVKLKKPTDANFRIFSLSGVLKWSATFTSNATINLQDANKGKKFEKGVYILSV